MSWQTKVGRKRKLMRVLFTPELLADMLTEGNEIRARVVHGLPADAVIVGFQEVTYRYEFIVYSRRFRALSNGEIIPTMDVMLETLR